MIALSHFSTGSLEEAWRYLQQMPGVGLKTAACALLFNMGRPLTPIDTHLQRLGLIGPKVSADQAHTIFLKALPPEWAYTLHVNLIRHGRAICHAQRPKCPQCPLITECAYAGSVNPEETMLPTKKLPAKRNWGASPAWFPSFF